jgi:hypothetical protein
VTRHIRAIAFVLMTFSALPVAWAQGQADKEAAAKQAEAAAKEAQQRDAEAIRRGAERSRLIPLSVDVVVSRYQGEKKISSLPYSLAVNANDNALGGVCQLRMGTQVPVPAAVVSKDGAAERSFSYRDIGTNIDCSARSLEEGNFQLRLTVEDTSVYTSTQGAPTPTIDQMPVFRSFRSTNTLVLRDGQTRDFSAAADRVSGEVVRIAVTLRVVK